MNGWEWTEGDGVQVARCDPVTRGTPFAHAFSGRRFDRPALIASAGIADLPIREVRQVHGSRVVAAEDVTAGTEADGVILTRDDRSVAAVRTADCVPVILVDPAGTAAAAVHAGWRGTVAGILGEAVRRLEASGCRAGDLRAALGPAIGVCCYRVGADVAEAVSKASGGAAGVVVRDAAGIRVDLRAALAAQGIAAGLQVAGIHRAPWCTACDSARFDSFRRDGDAAGRMVAMVGPAHHP